MILVLGQNPARASKTGQPFIGTQSGNRLTRILKYADVNSYVMMNVSNQITENNKPLKVSELKNVAESLTFKNLLSDYSHVITVGKQATKTLELALEYYDLKNIKHLSIPHTSPKNLIWNDWLTEVEVVKEIRNFINEI